MSAKSQANAERLSRNRTQERLFAHKVSVAADDDDDGARASGRPGGKVESRPESRADGRAESRADGPVAPPTTRPSTTTSSRRAATAAPGDLSPWSSSYLRNEAKELEEGQYCLLYPSSDPDQQQQYEGQTSFKKRCFLNVIIIICLFSFLFVLMEVLFCYAFFNVREYVFILFVCSICSAAYLTVAHDIFRPERLLNASRLSAAEDLSGTSAAHFSARAQPPHASRLVHRGDSLPLPPRSARIEPAGRAPLPALGRSASALQESDSRINSRRSSTSGSRSARPSSTGSAPPGHTPLLKPSHDDNQRPPNGERDGQQVLPRNT